MEGGCHVFRTILCLLVCQHASTFVDGVDSTTSQPQHSPDGRTTTSAHEVGSDDMSADASADAQTTFTGDVTFDSATASTTFELSSRSTATTTSLDSTTTTIGDLTSTSTTATSTAEKSSPSHSHSLHSDPHATHAKATSTVEKSSPSHSHSLHSDPHATHAKAFASAVAQVFATVEKSSPSHSHSHHSDPHATHAKAGATTPSLSPPHSVHSDQASTLDNVSIGVLNAYKHDMNPKLHQLLGKGQISTLGQAIESYQKNLAKFMPHLNKTEDFDVPPGGACSIEMKKFCHMVQFGSARIANCLREAQRMSMHGHFGIASFALSKTCRREVDAFFIVASRMKPTSDKAGPLPVDLVPGFRDACNPEALRLCGNDKNIVNSRLRSHTVMACLKQKNYQGTLSENCHDKILEVHVLESENRVLDAPFFDACKHDLRRIWSCRMLPYEATRGRRSKMKCLEQHVETLSEDCKREVSIANEEEAQDLRLNRDVYDHCTKEVRTLCKDVNAGEARLLKCLWGAQSDPSFSAVCKRKVHDLTKHMLSDYRLDFRIRIRCKAAIKDLCEMERAEAKEFRSMDNSSRKGIVVQCLKENYPSIEQDECKREVRRVVRIHATSPYMSPVFVRNCAADVGKFCPDVRPGSEHVCLRKHLQHIHEKCRSNVLVQGSLETTDISMKPEMNRVCASAIKQFCADVPQESAQVIRCLRKHHQEEAFPKPCADLTAEDLRGSQSDLRLKFGVAADCLSDARDFCDGELDAGGLPLIWCLMSKHKELQSVQCKQDMYRYHKAARLDILADPKTYGACVDDVALHCGDVRAGHGRVHQCLLKNREYLSPPCAAAEFEQKVLQADDVRWSPLTMRACKSVIKESCAGERLGDGSMWKCLEKHADGASNGDCLTFVKMHIKLASTELALNPEVNRYCIEEIPKLCKDVLPSAEAKKFSSEGRVIGCLIQKRNDIQGNHCRRAVLQAQKYRVQDIKNDPSAYQACENDIMVFCQNVRSAGRGRIHACLQRHLANISQPCRKVELSYMLMKSEDIRLNPNMKRDCRSEVYQYCSDVAPGRGRVIQCLLGHLHDSDMHGKCHQALATRMTLRSNNIALNPQMLHECSDDYKALVQLKVCPNFLKEGENLLAKVQNLSGELLQGTAIKCLIGNRKTLRSPGCSQAVLEEMRLRARDLRASAAMLKACSTDISQLCKNVPPGRGRWHSCLRKHASSITNLKCGKMVKKMAAAEVEDVTLNPAIARACVSEQRTFCPGIEHGKGRVISCLMQHMGMAGFGMICSLALNTMKNISSAWNVSVGNVTTQKMSTRDVLKWLEKHGHFEEKGGMLTGAIAGSLVTLALSGTCLWALQKRMKNGYAVVVPRSLDA